jgi:hypothetical protein
MGNKVPHFFFSENKLEAPGAGFITSTQSRMIGKVIKFDDARKFHQFILGNYKSQVVEVHGYTIVIEHYYGSVAEGFEEEQKSKIADELLAMADFYYEHTIKPKLSYYKRYLLHPEG